MSLNKLKELLQKFGPFVLLGIIVIFIIFYSVKIGLILYGNNKGEDLTLNPIFGVINKPQIKNSTTSAGLQFQIDTIEGKPVTATRSANVYFLPPTSTKFGYRETITNMAGQLGINNIASYNLQGNTARFQDPVRALAIDITNFNFNLNNDYAKQPELFARSIIPTGDEVQKKAAEILAEVEKYSKEFETAPSKVNYFFFNAEKNTKTAVARNIDANIAEVNFYRGGLDGIPTISKRYPNSINYVVLAATDRDYLPIEIQIKFLERSSDQIGTYPLKSAEQAYDELKKGKGVILFDEEPEVKNKLIKKMYIAYFESDEYMEYMLPVYVFEGENFAAVVWAISPEYFSE